MSLVPYQNAATVVLNGADEWWTLDSTSLITYSYAHDVGRDETRRSLADTA